jgi:hypothetical protein
MPFSGAGTTIAYGYGRAKATPRPAAGLSSRAPNPFIRRI